LEMLLAFAVVILTLTAVVGLIFGSQSLLLDSGAHSDSLRQAQAMLEESRAGAGADFESLVSQATVTQGSFYKKLQVEQTDFYTKSISGSVAWKSDKAREQQTGAGFLLTNWKDALEGNSCSLATVGDWTHPHMDSFDFAQLIGDSAHAYSLSTLQAYENALYVGADKTANKTDPTFFIFDISTPTVPVLVGKLDNAASTIAGINALAVSGTYAYVASARSVSASADFGQVQIIDIASSTLPVLKTTLRIPGVTAGNTSQAIGSSILYRNGHVYIGLSKTGSGPEFNIVDVSDPAYPVWVGGSGIGSGINALQLKGGYAYLAHPVNSGALTEQLTVMNIVHPASPQRSGGFFYSGGVGGNGKSVRIIGEKVYLGRTASKISGAADSLPDFFILDGSSAATVALPVLGGLPLATPESVNSFVVRGDRAFLLTSNQFQVWDVSRPSAPTLWASPSLTWPQGSSGTALSCRGNYFYAASTDAAGRGYLSIISSGP